MPPPGAVSRRRNNSSTAISASLTGDSDGPLVQFFSGVWNSERASAPASRTALASRAANGTRSSTSVACNSEALHAQRRRIGAVAEGQVVRRREACEHFVEMAGDGDFADRIGPHAVLDPEAGGAAAVLAGHGVDAHADQIGDVKAVLDVGDQRIGAGAAGLEIEIACAGIGHRRGAALRVAGGLEAEFAGAGAIEKPGGEHAVLDQRNLARDDAFGIERARALA